MKFATETYDPLKIPLSTFAYLLTFSLVLTLVLRLKYVLSNTVVYDYVLRIKLSSTSPLPGVKLDK